MSICKVIGRPALLEQTAEECAELAQACLKMSRKLRNENPTPKTEAEIAASIAEETADVYLCLYELRDCGLLNVDKVLEIMEAKKKRWENRLMRSPT